MIRGLKQPFLGLWDVLRVNHYDPSEDYNSIAVENSHCSDVMAYLAEIDRCYWSSHAKASEYNFARHL